MSQYLFCHPEADLRTDGAIANPDSEQIEHTVAKPQLRNFVSVEQIQEVSGSIRCDGFRQPNNSKIVRFRNKFGMTKIMHHCEERILARVERSELVQTSKTTLLRVTNNPRQQYEGRGNPGKDKPKVGLLRRQGFLSVRNGK